MTENLVERLAEARSLTDEQFRTLLTTDRWDADLFAAADRVRRAQYGTDVFIRGLIEFTNYCKNDCYYCGIRHGNRSGRALPPDAGADPRLLRRGLRARLPHLCPAGRRGPVFYGRPPLRDRRGDPPQSPGLRDHAFGRRALARKLQAAVFEAGANRYLLRHETADPAHYSRLHPANLRAENRQACLFDLKSIGYQVGAGFMVGSPYQTTDNLIADLRFLEKLQPDMIGIGPYITHAETPFAGQKNGSLELTLRLLAILRLMFPYVLLPATTALGTIHPEGRELGLKAGANVVMPNLSPTDVRALYTLYENKICTGEEAAQCIGCLRRRVESAGYRIVTARGDVKRTN